MSVCIREKRSADEPETTAGPDLGDQIIQGFQNTFNEENLNKGLEYANGLWVKAKVQIKNTF